jgi:tetratricopeptide (TPR) repeat protein
MDLQRAERSMRDRRVEEAEEICQSVLTERPDHVWALRLMAEIRLVQKRSQDASEFVEQALALDPLDPKLFNIRGRVRNNQDELDPAESDFRQALELDPQFADAYNNLGHILRRKGYDEAAEQNFRKALARDPEHGRANLNLGTMLYGQGHIDQAIRYLERGLKEQMTDRPGRYNLAIALHQVGRLDEAVHNYRQVIANGMNDADAFSNLAAALQAMGDLEGAASGFETALQMDPQHGPAIAGLAGLLELTGDNDRAIALLRPYLQLGLATAAVHVAYARILRHMDRGKEAIVHLAPLAKAGDLPPEQASLVHFTLGDLLDDIGEYDRAFAHYRRANELKGSRYSPTGREREVERLMQVFSKDNLPRLRHLERDAESPVLIVGMPRSGTSLVEQVLASHPHIHGAGELRDFGLMALKLGRNEKNIPYPECLNDIDEDFLRECSGTYLERLERGDRTALRVTDKMWQNFEHLGIVELVMPMARVIHCRRDPVDTGLSCYQQSFGIAGPPFAYDLRHIAHYYGQYRRLMAHWSEICSIRMIEVAYEDFVADLEGETRRLLAFLELEWDPGCLDFHENPRLVRTASHAQVRRPLYASSVGRARHYAQHLTPLIEGLREGGYLDE